MRANSSSPPPSLLGSFLFGGTRRALFGLLYLNPEQGYHLREIERLTGVTSGPAHRELKRMEEVGLLSSTKVGNQVHYRANTSNPLYLELRSIILKTVGLADLLREALEPFADTIKTAFIFGSIARGEERAGSDVDLLVVGEVSFVDVVSAVHPLHARLGREINPIVMRPLEFSRRRSEPSFIERVMQGETLILMGNPDDAEEPAQDRAPATPRATTRRNPKAAARRSAKSR